MKAYLSFNLNLPEDRDQFDLARKAAEMHLILAWVDQELRKTTKYGEKFHADVVRRELNEQIHEAGIPEI